ncbi:MAG TPA: hypothetical protein VIF57_05400 [Polyangia bacterium]|jgi:hypothetical protein
MSRILCAFAVVIAACGCGGGQSEAIKRGIGSACTMDSDCTTKGQVCLLEFKGGYCGVGGCMHDADCPAGSACVTADNQHNDCFLVCDLKTDCNPNRTADVESNCSSSLGFVDGTMSRKVCIPPSAGTGITDAGAD